MKRLFLMIVLAGTATCLLFSRCVFAGEMRIVHSIPFPTCAPTGLAYGADLAWDGEHLWTTILELNNGVLTYELEPSDGSVISSFTPPGDSHTGHAWDGTSLWIATNPGMELPDQIYKWSPGSSLSLSYFAPNSPDAHLTGAAWDGSHLWLADTAHGNRRILRVDPSNMEVVNSFSPPFSGPRGLTWDGTSLWCLSPGSRSVYQMDTSGDVLATWALPDIVRYANPYGLTFDGESFWVLVNGSQDIVPFPAQIYQLATPEPSALTLLAIAGGALLVLLVRHRAKATSPPSQR